MDWKAELDFELADAAETINEMQQALPGAGAITPELAALTGRLAHRAVVIRGYVARLELLQAPAPAPPVRPDAWTKEELESGHRFRQRIASAKAGNARRAAIAARRAPEQP